MNVTGVGVTSSLVVQSLGDMRSTLADLQRQLGTGKKSTTYAGLGIDRGLAVGLRAKLAAITGYADSITQVGVRTSLQQTALSQIASLSNTVKSATLTQQFNLDASGQTSTQRSAMAQLDQILGALNTPAGDRYLFSGRSGDKPATDTLDHIFNGDGARAGLKQMIAERNQADLGSNGLGRLQIPAAAGSLVAIAEETPPTVFGMKLASVTPLNGATVTGPTGSPAGVTVNFTSNPNPGDAITFAFNLPDGSKEQLTLTATTNSPPGPGEFTIDALPANTAANFQAALSGAVQKLAATSLSAASAMAAANNFFNVGAGQPPMRVNGPPFDSATSLIAGTPANTVTWYTGEMGADLARGTAVAKVDDALTVSYGARANEEAIRAAIANIAVYAVTTFSASAPNDSKRFAALAQRVGDGLIGQNGQQKIQDIQGELAFAQTTMNDAKERQQQSRGMLETMLQGIEQAPQEEVAAQILMLQTRLQASLQTTSMLYQLSIVNYL
ncbi:MAG: flagellar biosynthesis protein FlgL [Xanthobacteraceae bacterium]